MIPVEQSLWSQRSSNQDTVQPLCVSHGSCTGEFLGNKTSFCDYETCIPIGCSSDTFCYPLLATGRLSLMTGCERPIRRHQLRKRNNRRRTKRGLVPSEWHRVPSLQHGFCWPRR